MRPTSGSSLLQQQQPPPRLGTYALTNTTSSAQPNITYTDAVAFLAASRSPAAMPDRRADCPKVCLGRCANNWKNEMCNDKCNVCCQRCNCVPPGTGQDTRHICPCYDTMTNPHNGKLKCP
uniref:Uncharacterized protein n=1 Tax=Hordeum vulgare subsp. vulgare TaxID=112509 RepID=A0A8I6YVF2_HORVV